MSERAVPTLCLPLWAARLVGFAALASLGALQWQRMVEGLSSGRALLWVAAAVAAGAAVLACDRLPWRRRGIGDARRRRAGAARARWRSRASSSTAAPRNWDELVEGLVSGAQSLGTVRLPYDGADPWPQLTLQVTGSVLLTAAALLACWPRPRAAATCSWR